MLSRCRHSLGSPIISHSLSCPGCAPVWLRSRNSLANANHFRIFRRDPERHRVLLGRPISLPVHGIRFQRRLRQPARTCTASRSGGTYIETCGTRPRPLPRRFWHCPSRDCDGQRRHRFAQFGSAQLEGKLQQRDRFRHRALRSDSERYSQRPNDANLP